MFKSKLLLLSIAAALALASCSAPQQSPTSAGNPTPAEAKKITSVGVVKVQPGNADIVAGGSGNVVVKMTIEKGFHVNANPPTYPYLIATDLQIKLAEGISLTKVTYPTPITGTFAFADKPLAVYEGDTELKASLKADSSATKGSRSIPATLRVQACDDQVCYPPGTIELTIPLTIR